MKSHFFNPVFIQALYIANFSSGSNHVSIQLAVDLAVRYNGEIINADAMQMYRGLPIITNKISLQEQRSIPHHLLGNIGPGEETWVVGAFKREANKIIQDIRCRGRLPIMVGGTHYYTKALLFNDSLVESRDDSPERSLVHDNSSEFPILEDTTEAMWEKLKEVDPVMADRWHPNDRRKIRRSLEIFLTTGRRASDIYAEQQKRKAADVHAVANEESGLRPDSLLFWVHTEDKALKDRLNKRVDKMLDTGLMDEITEMDVYLQSRFELGESVAFTRGIWQSIGFKEFQPYLKALKDGGGGEELAELRLRCLEDMKTATRRYAKYQVKWISKQMIPLFEEQGILDRLYVLDSTDVVQYSEQVTDKALALAQKFLSGEDMPDPSSISDTARDVLRTAVASSSLQDTRCRKYCSLCEATMVTEEGWQKHIRGKAHRRKVRDMKRTALTPVEGVDNNAAENELTSPNLPMGG